MAETKIKLGYFQEGNTSGKPDKTITFTSKFPREVGDTMRINDKPYKVIEILG